MKIEKAAAILGEEGGRSGFGASKRRSVEHYKRMAMLSWKDKRRPIEERFWEKVKKGMDNECWPWTGCFGHRGYGRFSVNNKCTLSPRFAYELHNKVNPGKWSVLHTCDNPSCCNPAHLFLGTHQDNMADCLKKGRNFIPKSEDSWSVRLTKKDVAEIRQSQKGPKELAALYGVTPNTIYLARTGKTWKHIS